ncbi:MAG TPA: 30S ribosomal protein S20 [Syntrophales bacterium]|nr:30S ribosomal protein S20 [Syntrophales bacterium]HPX57207.1 30S ribosomal protein S20 [Syntrophales bacterium]HQA83002.1 30S ribosomal protein S20 [Syntrophales bacterium]
MATHKSAEKRSRQTEKRQERNTAIKSRVRTNIKSVLSAVEGKDQAGAAQSLGKAIPEIAKAAAKGILHKRNASRKISRLTRKVNALSKEA